MRQRLGFGSFFCVLLVLGGAGCGSSLPTATALREPQAEASVSLLVAQRLPEALTRTAGPESPGAPIFLAGHADGLLRADISPDGQRVLLASLNGAVSVIDMATGITRAARRMWASPAQGGLRNARFDASGTRVLLTGLGPPYGDSLFVWDLHSDTLLPGQATDLGNVSDVTVAADGRLVTVTAAGTVDVRDPATLVIERSMMLRDAAGEPFNPDYVWVSPTTTRFIALRNAWLDLDRDAAGRLWREPVPTLSLYSADGQLVADLTPGPEAPSAGAGFRSAGFRPGGGLLATVTTAGVVQLRHPESGATLYEPVLPGPAQEAVWTRDGELLLVLDADHENQVHFVEPASGARVATVTLSTQRAWPLDSVRQPDGSVWVFSGRALDAFTGTGEARPHPLTPFPDMAGEAGWSVLVSANGTRAVALQGSVIQTVDLERGVTLARRALTDGPRSVWGAVFVPSGVLMTNRESGVLFRANQATPVYCAGAGTRLVGQGATQRVVGPAATCGLDDGEPPELPEGALGEFDYASAQSADGTVLVVMRGHEASVQELRTGRVRMRVPAADRTVPNCSECGVHYALSPDGATLAVYDVSIPLALFDTRSGRRVARLTKAGRAPSWMAWSGESRAFALLWSAASAAEGAADTIPALSVLTIYDHRGRELAAVEANPDDQVGGVGTAMSPTHVAAFQGSRASVVELRGRRVTALSLAHGVVEAEWLGTTLRLTVIGEEGMNQLLFAPSASTPYFQHEGAGTFTPDARWVFRCREGELERLRVSDLARTSFGRCIATALFPSEDGRFVAQPHGDHLRVVRDDGAVIRLAALSNDSGMTAFAVEEATGRFTTFGTPPAHESYRYRQPGPAISARVVRASSAAEHVDAQLLERFFAAPGGS